MKLAWMISSFREKTMNVRDNKTGRFADEERAKTDKDNVTVETQKPIDMMLFCPVRKTKPTSQLIGIIHRIKAIFAVNVELYGVRQMFRLMAFIG
jgi:hypothetical protein